MSSGTSSKAPTPKPPTPAPSPAAPAVPSAPTAPSASGASGPPSAGAAPPAVFTQENLDHILSELTIRMTNAIATAVEPIRLDIQQIQLDNKRRDIALTEVMNFTKALQDEMKKNAPSFLPSVPTTTAPPVSSAPPVAPAAPSPPLTVLELNLVIANDAVSRARERPELVLDSAKDAAFDRTSAGIDKIDAWLSQAQEKISCLPEFRILMAPFAEVWAHYKKENPGHVQARRFKPIVDAIVHDEVIVTNAFLNSLPESNAKEIRTNLKARPEVSMERRLAAFKELDDSDVDLTSYSKDYSYVYELVEYIRAQAGINVQYRADGAQAKLFNFRFYASGSFPDQLTMYQGLIAKMILAFSAAKREHGLNESRKKYLLLTTMDKELHLKSLVAQYRDSCIIKDSNPLSFSELVSALRSNYQPEKKQSKASKDETKKSDSSNNNKQQKKPESGENRGEQKNNQNQNQQRGKGKGKGGRWKGKSNPPEKKQEESTAASAIDLKKAAPNTANDPPDDENHVTLTILEADSSDPPANLTASSLESTIIPSTYISRNTLILDSGSAYNIGVGEDVMEKNSVRRIGQITLQAFAGGKATCHESGTLRINPKRSVSNALICRQAKFNILSVPAITASGNVFVLFTQNRGLVINKSNLKKETIEDLTNKKNIILAFERKAKVYSMPLPEVSSAPEPKTLSYHREASELEIPRWKNPPPSSFERTVARSKAEEQKAAAAAKPKAPVRPAQSSLSASSPSFRPIIPRLPSSSSSSVPASGAPPIVQSSSSSSQPSNSVSFASSSYYDSYFDEDLSRGSQYSEAYDDDQLGTNFICSLVPFSSLALPVNSESSPEPQPETRDVGIQADRRIESQSWHSRLGHIGLQSLINCNQYYELSLSRIHMKNSCDNCSTCSICKQRRTNITERERRRLLQPLLPSSEVPAVPLPPSDLTTIKSVSADLIGPMSFLSEGEQLKAPSLFGSNYVLVLRFTLSDPGAKLIQVRALVTKKANEVVPAIIEIIEKVERQSGLRLLNFHSDGGGEFVNSLSQPYFSRRGIRQTFTAADTPELNPTERENYSLILMTRCMLFESGAPIYLWDLAVLYCSYIFERLPQPQAAFKCALEAFFNVKPSLRLVHTFGSNCRTIDPQPSNRPGKFQPRGFAGVFVGISEEQTCPVVLCTDPGHSRYLTISPLRSVRIEEGLFTNLEGIASDVQSKAEWQAGQSEEDEYEVERILAHDAENNRFLVKWKRWATTTWEPRAHLKNSPLILKEFFALQKKNLSNSSGVPSSSSVSSVSSSHVDSSIGLDGIALVCALNLIASAVNDVIDEFGDLTPGSYNSARQSKDWPLWEGPINAEYEALDRQQTFEEVSVDPKTHLLDTRHVFKIKRGPNNEIVKRKARLVVKGFQQIYGSEYLLTHSPTPKMKCLKILLSMAAAGDWEILQMDFENAFVHAKLDETVYIRIPQGYKLKNPNLKRPALRLVKSLYGLKQAPRMWYLAFHNFLISLGFLRLEFDHCIWSLNCTSSDGTHAQLYLCTHVDDTVAFVPTPLLPIWTKIMELFRKNFLIKDLGEAKWILKLEVTRDRAKRTLTLSQRAYVSSLILRFPVAHSRSPPSTPYWKDDLSTAPQGCDSSPLSSENHFKFRSMVGALLYAANMTRFDIAHIVNVLCRFFAAPSFYHLQSAEYVVRYLSTRTELLLTLGAPDHFPISSIDQFHPPVNFAIWSDSDHANERGGEIGEKRHSISGQLVTINGHTAWWSSTKQTQLAQSSTEAELYALNGASREAAFIRFIFRDLFLRSLPPIVLLADNDGAALISHHNTSHNRTKHIDLKDLYIREELANENIVIQLVATVNNLADILTKSFPSSKRQRFYQLLSLLGFDPSLSFPP